MRREPGFGFILVTLLIAVLGIGLIIPVLPRLVTELSGGSPSDSAFVYGIFVAVYAAMQFLFSPLIGALSDRFGRRPVLLVSVAGSAVDYLFLAFAPTLALLFVGRLISGITAATLATANAYVADVTPPEQRPKRFGIMGAVFGLGFVIGPLVGGILGEYSLRLPFLFAAGLAGVSFVYGWLVLPESLPPESRSKLQLRKANPLAALVALKQYRGVIPLASVLTMLNLAQFSLHSVWVLYTAYRFNWGTRDVGLSLAFVGVMAAVVQGGLTGKVVKLVGERKTVYLGATSAALAFMGYGLSTAGWMLYPAIVLGAIGGLVGPASQSLITREVGKSHQGAVQGALTSLSSLCYVVAPLVATWLFGHFSGKGAIAEIPGVPFFAASAMAVTALMIALVFVRPHESKEAEPIAVAPPLAGE